MSRPSAAAIKNDIQRTLSLARKDIERLVADVSGANSEPVKKAAFRLAGTWRKVLSVPRVAIGPDLAHAPPRLRSGKLRKSISTAVVEGMRRVGSGNFRARLLEFGYGGRRTFSVENGVFREGFFVRRKRKTLVSRGAPVPPRPHASVALELAKDKMLDVMVSEIQKKTAEGGAR